jgi:hypothetical protein
MRNIINNIDQFDRRITGSFGAVEDRTSEGEEEREEISAAFREVWKI